MAKRQPCAVVAFGLKCSLVDVVRLEVTGCFVRSGFLCTRVPCVNGSQENADSRTTSVARLYVSSIRPSFTSSEGRDAKEASIAQRTKHPKVKLQPLPDVILVHYLGFSRNPLVLRQHNAA